MLFENKCFNCPVRRVMEKDFHDIIKDQYRENGIPIVFSCGGVFNPRAQNFGKNVEFYQQAIPCDLDLLLSQHKQEMIKKIRGV